MLVEIKVAQEIPDHLPKEIQIDIASQIWAAVSNAAGAPLVLNDPRIKEDFQLPTGITHYDGPDLNLPTDAEPQQGEEL